MQKFIDLSIKKKFKLAWYFHVNTTFLYDLTFALYSCAIRNTTVLRFCYCVSFENRSSILRREIPFKCWLWVTLSHVDIFSCGRINYLFNTSCFNSILKIAIWYCFVQDCSLKNLQMDIKKWHTCEESGAYLRISFWHSWWTWKTNI